MRAQRSLPQQVFVITLWTWGGLLRSKSGPRSYFILLLLGPESGMRPLSPTITQMDVPGVLGGRMNISPFSSSDSMISMSRVRRVSFPHTETSPWSLISRNSPSATSNPCFRQRPNQCSCWSCTSCCQSSTDQLWSSGPPTTFRLHVWSWDGFSSRVR